MATDNSRNLQPRILHWWEKCSNMNDILKRVIGVLVNLRISIGDSTRIASYLHQNTTKISVGMFQFTRITMIRLNVSFMLELLKLWRFICCYHIFFNSTYCGYFIHIYFYLSSLLVEILSTFNFPCRYLEAVLNRC